MRLRSSFHPWAKAGPLKGPRTGGPGYPGIQNTDTSLVRDVVLLLCFGSLCRSMLDSDASLYSSQYPPLDVLLLSRLLINMSLSSLNFFLR
jgi:hypothetical protein